MRKMLFVAVALVLAVTLLTAAYPSTASAAGPAYYVVRPGDTLFSIASRYGMSTWAIANANRLWNPNYIYAGQVLVIPFVPGPIPGPLPGPVCSVRVNYGDTLSSIAWRLHTDVGTLARANGIYNLNWIYAGQWLRIPNCTNPVPGPWPTPIPSARRIITGNWLASGNYMLQLSEATGCPGPSCAVQGQYFAGFGTPGAQVNGTVDVTTGAVSLTITASPTITFTGTIGVLSKNMAGQLSGVGAVTFVKQ